MRTNDTYHGYTYQKRCALFYLLDKFANADFKAISLEHPKGDDFDLHFSNKKEVYQTKDYKSVFSSHMKDFILAMWRKYSENINNPPTKLDVEMAFIFSNIFNLPEFTAIKNRKHEDKSLNQAWKYILKDSNCKIKPNKQEWNDFLNKLYLYIHSFEEVDEKIKKIISLMFNAYKFEDTAINKIKNDLLEKLDSLMSGKQMGHLSTKVEIQEQIDWWHNTFWREHVGIKAEILKHDKEILRKNPEPPISSKTTGVIT